MISLDWLTINCLKSIDYGYQKQSIFLIKDTKKSSRFFSKIETVYYQDNEFATILHTPYEKSILDPFLIQIKIHNKYLYDRENLIILKKFITCLNLSFKDISRVDIAIDHTVFDSGLEPQSFIKMYSDNKIVKIGAKSFKITGYNNHSEHTTGISFGKRSSDVFIQYYNKTVEIRDISNKTYIKKCWDSYGINPTSDVYRLEFALKNQALKIVDKSTGEMLSLDTLESLSDSNLEKFANALIDKYFSFLHVQPEIHKSHWKPLNLYNRIKSNFVLKPMEKNAESTMADKIMINRLIKQLEKPDITKNLNIKSYIEIISTLVMTYNLDRWFRHAHPNYSYICDSKKSPVDEYIKYFEKAN